MNYLQIIAIVRGRGQLTIPDSIRSKTDWVGPGSVVTVSRVKTDEIVIKPHLANSGKTDWNRLWKNIYLSRSYTGTYSGSLSEFIASDREDRR